MNEYSDCQKSQRARTKSKHELSKCSEIGFQQLRKLQGSGITPRVLVVDTVHGHRLSGTFRCRTRFHRLGCFVPSINRSWLSSNARHWPPRMVAVDSDRQFCFCLPKEFARNESVRAAAASNSLEVFGYSSLVHLRNQRRRNNEVGRCAVTCNGNIPHCCNAQ